MIKIGINGFGRIGRAIFRQALASEKFTVAAVNDIDGNLGNHAYLLKFDTTYGKLDDHEVEAGGESLIVDGYHYPFYSHSHIGLVPWNSHDVDVIIDASGVTENVRRAHDVLAHSSVKKIVVTHAPSPEDIDITLMDGVNVDRYDNRLHHVISSSICDANAVAPFFQVIDNSFGIEVGQVTTLHPWLQYQNLLDGLSQSVSSPGHQWNDYALGRSSVGSLIPKETTLVSALEHVLPGISQRMHATSFRTPTSIVSVADGVFLLSRKAEVGDVTEALGQYCKNNPGVLLLDGRSLVSIDYTKSEYAAVVDTRWLHLNGQRLLKFVLWYDNEWGYASRALRIVDIVSQQNQGGG